MTMFNRIATVFAAGLAAFFTPTILIRMVMAAWGHPDISADQRVENLIFISILLGAITAAWAIIFAWVVTEQKQ